MTLAGPAADVPANWFDAWTLEPEAAVGMAADINDSRALARAMKRRPMRG